MNVNLSNVDVSSKSLSARSVPFGAGVFPPCNIIQVIAEVAISTLFHEEAYKMHEIAVLLLFGYAMCIFNDYQRTKWVGDTVAASLDRLKDFLPVLFCVIVISASQETASPSLLQL